MYKHLYSRFISANPETLHFAAHSHYYWPDVSREAQLQYWDDSAKFVDKKWDYLFSEVIPKAQRFVSQCLNTGQPEQVVFAPNTHELVCRLLSCFPNSRPVKILTTDSEFYSFDRQVKRMSELGMADVHQIPVEPFETFEERVLEAIKSQGFDLIFVSSIFFNCGLGLRDLANLVKAARDNRCTLVIDGYHSFCALPMDFSPFADDVYFLAGGYKYVQSGEGVCFLHVPKGSELLPANTGWFAEFGDLDHRNSQTVPFARNGMKFAGATFDPSGIYRFNSVMEMLHANQLNAGAITEHVRQLQKRFLKNVEELKEISSSIPLISSENLVDSSSLKRGHFFAFDLGSHQTASDLAKALFARNVVTDVRDSRIRFGFGLYQDLDDVDQFFERLKSIG